MNAIPPFHPLTEKKRGDRVKVAKNPLDESLGFDFGVVLETGLRTYYTLTGLRVRMDESPRYFGSDENTIHPSHIFLLA